MNELAVSHGEMQSQSPSVMERRAPKAGLTAEPSTIAWLALSFSCVGRVGGVDREAVEGWEQHSHLAQESRKASGGPTASGRARLPSIRTGRSPDLRTRPDAMHKGRKAEDFPGEAAQRYGKNPRLQNVTDLGSVAGPATSGSSWPAHAHSSHPAGPLGAPGGTSVQ